MRLADGTVVKYSDDISDEGCPPVGFGLMWFVARAVPAGTDQDQPLVGLEGVHTATHSEDRYPIGDPVHQHEWRAFPLDLVVDADAVIVREGHRWHVLSPI